MSAIEETEEREAKEVEAPPSLMIEEERWR
jgi:hypothetical protein